VYTFMAIIKSLLVLDGSTVYSVVAIIPSLVSCMDPQCIYCGYALVFRTEHGYARLKDFCFVVLAMLFFVMSPLWDIITVHRFMMTRVARWML
jgi:hypothetical protein